MLTIKNSCSKLWLSSFQILLLAAVPFLEIVAFGKIAQQVEQRTENPCRVGSIPTLPTIYVSVVQLVEHTTDNRAVTGSIPVWNTIEGIVSSMLTRPADRRGIG